MGQIVHKFLTTCKIAKVERELGLILGYGVICKEDGEPYFDVQTDHATESGLVEAAADFMLNSRNVKEMHRGVNKGSVVFAFPLTTDIAKAFDITIKKSGLLLGIKPDNQETLEKAANGEFTGFSIGGAYLEVEEVEVD